MATRGHMGGLARATSDAALVLDAAGKSLVIIETVGVGQDEVDIVRTADISVVVLVPGTGDDVQALKAGIMEIADIFVVNKCDRDGADRMVTSIESNLALQSFGEGEWRPPIVKTEATTGKGVPELWQTIKAFRAHSEGTRAKRLKARNEFRLRDLLTHRFMEHVEQGAAGPRPSSRRSSIASPGARSIRTPRPRISLRERFSREPGTRNLEPQMKAVLDHVGIAVSDLQASLAFFRDVLGLHVEASEEIASQRVRATFLNTGQSTFEMLEATAADSPIAKFIEKRGAGMHHVALRVDDIEAALAHLRVARHPADRREAAPRRGRRARRLHPSVGGARRARRAEAAGAEGRAVHDGRRGIRSAISS